jgi:hypothetical protein
MGFCISDFELTAYNTIVLVNLAAEITWCGYEVPGRILFRDLGEAMSVHVSACTSYDFNTLMPVVSYGTHKMCVFYVSQK